MTSFKWFSGFPAAGGTSQKGTAFSSLKHANRTRAWPLFLLFLIRLNREHDSAADLFSPLPVPARNATVLELEK